MYTRGLPRCCSLHLPCEHPPYPWSTTVERKNPLGRDSPIVWLGVVTKMHHAVCVALVSPLTRPTALITRCLMLSAEGPYFLRKGMAVAPSIHIMRPQSSRDMMPTT